MDSSSIGGRLRPSPRTVFARRFAELFDAAGNPTLRRVAAAADARLRSARAAGQKGGVSIQRISDWKAGRNLPAKFETFLPVVLTLVDEARKSSAQVSPALLSVQEWQRLWTAAIEWDPASAATECPYLGLTAYRRQDTELFFGRTRPTEEFVELVRGTVGPGGQGGIVMLVGASGAGKSSLLEAGVVPELAQPERDWAIATMTPGPDPVGALLAAVSARAADTSTELAEPDSTGEVETTSAATPLADEAPTAETITRTLADWGTGLRRLLIIDQFEELFTLCPDDDQREVFLSALEHLAIRGEREPTAVILAVRADFYARCVDIPVLEDALKHRSYLLGPMRLDELAEAITRPAELAGYKLESGLEELVISELCGLGSRGERRAYDPGALPLVSHVMEAVWQRRDGMRLTIDGYEQAGGVLGSVAATAEKAWSELSEFQRAVGKRVLLGLVAVGDDSRDTRRKVARAELVRQTVEAAETALEVLARTRLITLDSESAYLTHEIVLDAWPRLRSWIDEDRVGYLERQRLQADASDWIAGGRDPSLLYRGARLTTMELHIGQGQLGPAGEEFLAAARLDRQRAERRSTARKSVLALLGVIALVLAGVAFVQNDTARQQRDRAIFTAVLAEADRVRDSDPAQSAQLALVADKIRPGDPAVRARLLDTQSLPLDARISGHTGSIWDVDFRRDGQIFASAGTDRTIRLWDATGAVPTRRSELSGHTDDVLSVVFSPDGTLLASASRDATVRLWDVRNPDAPAPVGKPLPGGALGRIRFDQDGKILVTSAASQDTRAFWDITNPAEPTLIEARLPLALERYRAGTLSSDLRRLATPDDQGIQLWDTTDLRAARPLGRIPGGSSLSEFSPDGRILVVGLTDVQTVQLWDVSDAMAPRKLGTPLPVSGSLFPMPVAFSSDGKRMATHLTQDRVQVWALDDPAHPVLLSTLPNGSSGFVTAFAFGSDGRIVTSTQEGILRHWSLPRWGSDNLGYVPRSTKIELDDSGSLMALATSSVVEKTDVAEVELFRVENPGEPRRVGRLTMDEPFGRTTLSPDGRMLFTAGLMAGGKLFDISDPAAIRLLAEVPAADPSAGFQSAVFSPDSRRLITTYSTWPDPQLRVWDLTDRTKPVALGQTPILSGEYDVAVSPDGRLLASFGTTEGVRLWDMTQGGSPRFVSRIALGPNEQPARLAFAPDSRALAVSAEDKTIRLWDITEPPTPVALADPLKGHSAFVSALAFSPDGRTLASTGFNSEIRLWDISSRERPVAVGYPLATGTLDDGYRVVFHPAGGYLVSGSAPGGVRWWDLDIGRSIDRICRVTPSALDASAWSERFPDIALDPPCAGTP
ncbi:AAA family ATPase [Nocardia sp. NPDC051832]|uniref:AAA family ATPase n=1 Tax=Nocardia sp. NPDC051832 TaxID=3155673 RepID=UPI0034160DCD